MSPEMVNKIEYSEAFTEEIYLVLADFSWQPYKKSKFTSYFGWCNYIHKCVCAGQLEPVKEYIREMAHASNKFLGFPEEELYAFSMEFFMYSKYDEYYEHIRLFKALYGGYIIKKNI